MTSTAAEMWRVPHGNLGGHAEWTAARLAVLRRGVDAGWSMVRTGALIGLSERTCAAKAHELGWRARPGARKRTQRMQEGAQ